MSRKWEKLTRTAAGSGIIMTPIGIVPMAIWVTVGTCTARLVGVSGGGHGLDFFLRWSRVCESCGS